MVVMLWCGCWVQVPVLAAMEMDGIAVDRLKLIVQLPSLEKRCQQLTKTANEVRYVWSGVVWCSVV